MNSIEAIFEVTFYEAECTSSRPSLRKHTPRRSVDILAVEIDRDSQMSFRAVAQYVGVASALTLLVIRLIRLGE